jgi:uncharacterized membrane protein (DUF4010 family)
VTLSFSRESRHEAAPGRALAVGVIAACTVLLVRVGVLAAILNPAVGWRVVPYLLLPLAAGLGVAIMARRWEVSITEASLPGNPLRLVAAIQMALGSTSRGLSRLGSVPGPLVRLGCHPDQEHRDR